ncbi:hypothetical protein ACFV3N_05625 [Streptomyces bauhiniae]|uniref:hypothetical protein n=1 Tax=Streptomyces bauhiniae TaxID=2340725 RepID=UPI003650FEC3
MLAGALPPAALALGALLGGIAIEGGPQRYLVRRPEAVPGGGVVQQLQREARDPLLEAAFEAAQGRAAEQQ